MKFLLAAITAGFLVPMASAVEVLVSYSDKFASELVEDYGVREGIYLTTEITEDVSKAFADAGLDVARIEVTIIDAKPNHPTFEQMRDKPGLDWFRSRSIGGMKLEGKAFDAQGNVLGTREYSWYENDIRNVVAHSTWSDAKRASDRFARKLVEQVKLPVTS